MTAPAAPGPAATEPHSHLKHLAIGAGIGGATVAVGGGAFLAARRATVGAGHVKTLVQAGRLSIDGPRIHSVAHPDLKRLVTSGKPRSQVLAHLSDRPDLMQHLHKDLRSPTPSKHALAISRMMHPNGSTNASIAHSRGKTHLDLLHDPTHADADIRSHATKKMIEHADAKHTPDLHRGMRGVEHHVGDVVDFGHYSSFTSTRPIAEIYAHQKGAHPGIYRIPKGTAKAMPLDGTGWASRNHEWVAGGKFKVVGKKSVDVNGQMTHHYDLAPHTDVSKSVLSWEHGQKNTNAYHWMRDGMLVGGKRRAAAAPVKQKYDAGVKELSHSLGGGLKAKAFKAGVVIGDHGTRPTTLAAAGVAAGAAATTLAVRHHMKEKSVAKSAFGVEHVIEKNFLTSALTMGHDALGGLKAGLGGKAPKALLDPLAKPGATQVGRKTGSALRTGGMKLKPLVSTPGRAAATAGGGAAIGGFALGHQSNN